MNHPDWNAVAAYLDSRLPPRERADFLRRLMACREFRQEVRECAFLRASWELAVDSGVADGAGVAQTAERAKALIRARPAPHPTLMIARPR